MLGRNTHPGFSTPDLEFPRLFHPLASRITGTEDAKSPKSDPTTADLAAYNAMPPGPSQKAKESYVRHVCGDLNFSEDVVEERSYHLTSYDGKYLQKAFDLDGVVDVPKKTFTIPSGRHNARGPDLRHTMCHLQHRTTYKLKPLKRQILKRAKEMHEAAMKEKAKKEEEERKKVETENESLFSSADMQDRVQSKQELEAIKEYNPILYKTLRIRRQADKAVKAAREAAQAAAPIEEVKNPVSARPQGLKKGKKKLPTILPSNLWAEATLSRMTENTANWITAHHTMPQYKEKLETFLTERYGHLNTKPDLIQVSDDEEEEDQESDSGSQHSIEPKPSWRKPNETLLDRIRILMKEKGVTHTDPYDDETDAAFYRLPTGFRMAKKEQMKEEEAICNSTAYNITLPVRVPPPIPNLRDQFNPKIGNKLLETNNIYQQQLLTSDELPDITQQEEKPDVIFLGNNKFKKQLQPVHPIPVTNFCPEEEPEPETEDDLMDIHMVKLINQGFLRWSGLPQPLDQEEFKEMMRNEVQYHATLLSDPEKEEAAQALEANKPVHTAMTKIAEEWRRRWYMDMRYSDATPDALIQDMADFHPHIRLRAITTCARAAEYKPPPQMGVLIGESGVVKEHMRLLPDKLFTALECCLEDVHPRVQLAAAIALYTLEKPIDKAEDVLRDSITNGSALDKWAACQCLAFYGECDSEIVDILLKRLLREDNPVEREQAAALLVSLSQCSTLIHSLLAECLNSNHWRHRLIACRLMPRLKQPLNRDLCHKLHYLMWNDWHGLVRQSAAQTLGKTGHGREVHDQLLIRLCHHDERLRVEALDKVGYLGIMTLKLLPAFLQSFSDNYDSVRQAACRACANLHIKDQKIIDKLIYVLTYDPVWKVKEMAIHALSSLQQYASPAVVNAVVWAFRYEDSEEVRVQACAALLKISQMTPSLVDILQSQFLVEHSEVVRRQIQKTLTQFGISATQDSEMLAQIKSEVRHLCVKSKVASSILKNEHHETKVKNFRRLLHMPESMKRSPPPPPTPIFLKDLPPKVEKRDRSRSRGTSAKSSHPPSIPEEDEEEDMTDAESDQEIKDIFVKSHDPVETPDISLQVPESESSSDDTRPQTKGSARDMLESDQLQTVDFTSVKVKGEESGQSEKHEDSKLPDQGGSQEEVMGKTTDAKS